MVTWLEVNHKTANPEAIEDFIFFGLSSVCDLYKFCHLAKSLYRFHFALFSVLLLSLRCHFPVGSGVWRGRQYLGCTTLTSTESFTQWHVPLVHFPGRPRKGWTAVLCISNRIFCMWIPCFQGWFGFFKSLGVDVSRALECPLLMAPFSLAWVRLQGFYSRETWSSFKTESYQCL